jgi:succinate dehydrogenase / fumarate reductase, cytochrome b subunit
MQKKRPMFLNLLQIRFPVTAILSIGHRLSGVALFLSLPWLLYLFAMSTFSQNTFDAMIVGVHKFPQAPIAFVVLAAALYHLIAGVRHLIMDIGIGESWCVAKASAYFAFVAWVVLLVICGVCIW